MYRILNNRAAPILKEQFTRSGDLPENYNSFYYAAAPHGNQQYVEASMGKVACK